MTTPTFTDPPAEAPARTQTPATFVANFNAFMAWVYVFFGEMITAVAWFAATAVQVAADRVASAASAVAAAASATAATNVATLVDTSNTSLSPTIGAKAITLNTAGRTFANLQRVVLTRLGDRNVRGSGIVSLAAMGAGPPTMTVTFDKVSGAGGPYTDWLVRHEAFDTLPPATVAEVLAGLSDSVGVTPAGLFALAAVQTLAYANPLNLDGDLGAAAYVVLTGNAAIAAPTHLHDGVVYTYFLAQDATGGRVPTFNAIFDFGLDGAPTLSTGANKVDMVSGPYSAITGKIHVSTRLAA